MFTGILLGATTYKYFTIFTEVAILYFIICYPWALLATWVERRMKASPDPTSGIGPRRLRWVLGPAAST